MGIMLTWLSLAPHLASSRFPDQRDIIQKEKSLGLLQVMVAGAGFDAQRAE